MDRLLFLVLFLFAGLASTEDFTTLEDALWRSAGVEVVVDLDESVLAKRIDPWLVDLRVRTGLTGVRGRGGAARVVVGGPDSEEARGLVERTGIRVEDGAFTIGSDRFDGPTDRIVACFEDPIRPGLPVTVVLTNDVERLAAGLIRLPVGVRPAIQIWSEGEPVRTGELDRKGALVGEWRDRLPQLLGRVRRLNRVPGEAFDLWAPLQREKGRLRRYVRRCTTAEDTAARWFGKDTGPRAGLYIHEDPRSVSVFAGGAASAGGRIAAVNVEERRVHALLVPELAHDGGAGIAAAAVVSIAGPPARAWMLDAVGAAAAEWVRGAPLLETVAAWASTDPTWNAEELFSLESLRRGPASRDAAMRALGFVHLATTLDRHELRRLWREGVPMGTWKVIAPSIEDWLERLAARRVEPERRAFEENPIAGAIVVGSLSPPGTHDLTRTGYWRDGLRVRLKSLVAAGANTVVFTFRPTLLQREALFGAPRFDASADDALELAFATRVARQAGLRVGIQLEPISGGLSSWPDESSQSQSELSRFEERYGARLGELGLAAEASGAEFLMVGASLRGLTRSRELEDVPSALRALRAERRDTWIRLVARLRQVFAGPIGYTARVGSWTIRGEPGSSEIAEIGFLDDLDFVALHCDPRWEERPESGRQVERLYTQVLNRSLRFIEQKPFLLIAGTPSAARAWEFAAPVGEPDPAWQRMVAHALAGQCSVLAKREEWLGAAWWSVRAEPSEDTPRDFDPLGPAVPGGPPALEEFAEFLLRAKGR